MSNVIIWFRRDLRLQDNLALSYAIGEGYNIIPIYIYAPAEEAPWQPGAASRWWLHHSLRALNSALQQKLSQLLFFQGKSQEILLDLIQLTRASAVYWNRLYEPTLIERDRKIQMELQQRGIIVHTFPGYLLHEPWHIQNRSNQPYQVFTPFWKTCQRVDLNKQLPLPAPGRLNPPKKWPQCLDLNEFNLLPCPNWAEKFSVFWQPGEAGAWQRLQAWCQGAISDYAELRDFPSTTGVSRLSPHLHFGELSPRQVLGASEYALYHLQARVRGVASFERQLYWREFAYHLLYHFPHTPQQPLRSAFKHFPWRHHYDTLLKAWQQGMTGYPLIDAGMRELWTTGWMHNRVRMVVASFLTKNAAIPWQEGTWWFWDTLVDANLANNTLGWQWVAGCGADAAPYYRIFNPLLQSTRFDAKAEYLRRWLPELAHLPAEYCHRPWAITEKKWFSQKQLDYPQPIIDYEQSRREALAAYQKVKNNG
jgi:deoxyribodipyrimidine photo-lyase